MNETRLSLGPAPDFVMRRGRQTVYHIALVEVLNDSGVKNTFTHSHASFVMVLQEISMRCMAMGINKVSDFRWITHGETALEFVTDRILVRIVYRLNNRLPIHIQCRLNESFRKHLDKLLYFVYIPR